MIGVMIVFYVSDFLDETTVSSIKHMQSMNMRSFRQSLLNTCIQRESGVNSFHHLTRHLATTNPVHTNTFHCHKRKSYKTDGTGKKRMRQVHITEIITHHCQLKTILSELWASKQLLRTYMSVFNEYTNAKPQRDHLRLLNRNSHST